MTWRGQPSSAREDCFGAHCIPCIERGRDLYVFRHFIRLGSLLRVEEQQYWKSNVCAVLLYAYLLQFGTSHREWGSCCSFPSPRDGFCSPRRKFPRRDILPQCGDQEAAHIVPRDIRAVSRHFGRASNTAPDTASTIPGTKVRNSNYCISILCQNSCRSPQSRMTP